MTTKASGLSSIKSFIKSFIEFTAKILRVLNDSIHKVAHKRYSFIYSQHYQKWGICCYADVNTFWWSVCICWKKKDKAWYNKNNNNKGMSNDLISIILTQWVNILTLCHVMQKRPASVISAKASKWQNGYVQVTKPASSFILTGTTRKWVNITMEQQSSCRDEVWVDEWVNKTLGLLQMTDVYFTADTQSYYYYKCFFTKMFILVIVNLMRKVN